jgi:hypothetical protein
MRKTPPASLKHQAHGPKGNSHTEFTPQELERMVLEAAHQRAEQSRSRSGA